MTPTDGPDPRAHRFSDECPCHECRDFGDAGPDDFPTPPDESATYDEARQAGQQELFQ